MKINDIYIEQTNRFCDANCKVTAEDILAKAKQRQAEESANPKTDAKETSINNEVSTNTANNTKKKTNTKQNIFRIMQAVAACIGIFLLSGTTILAINGDLATFIQSIFTDDATAEIIADGHIYAIDEYEDCGDFALNLVAISGDRDNPQVIMDVYIKDDALAAANDRIFLTAYVLGVEEYENEREQYGMTGWYGTKDPEVPNLYHVTFRGAPAWLAPGKEAVIAVQDIFTDISAEETVDLAYWSMRDYFEFDLGEPEFTIHEVGYEYRVTVPDDIYAGITTRNYHSVVLEGEKYDFVLDSVEYGHYSSSFTFYIDYPEGTAPANEEERTAIQNELQRRWLGVGSSIVIIVDGEEYKFTEGFLGNVNWRYNGTTNNLKRGYVSASLPAIDYFEAESIILQFGDQTIDLKESL